MTTPHALPDIAEKSDDDIARMIQGVRDNTLSEAEQTLVIKCIELALWLPLYLQKKTISLRRLRTLLFGKGYSSPPPPSASLPVVDAEPAADDIASSAPVVKKPGHGRLPHTAYEQCEEVTLAITDYAVGDRCLCSQGKLRRYGAGVLLRVRGQSMARVIRYTVEKLRCDACQVLVTAPIPPEVGTEKYDASFKAWLALQKYYVAVPLYRQEHFLKLLGFPLSDATQWDLIEQLAGACYPVFTVLQRLAAQGKLIHNDDTPVRILAVIKAIKANPQHARTGMTTSGFMAEYEGHTIALFMNNTDHAGENLAALLKHRLTEQPPILQMCDASNNNLPGAIETIVCNCLSHGFRKFSELVDYFPEPCLIVMKALSAVYQQDEKTRGMTDAQRLLHHQTHSEPLMDTLKQFVDQQLHDHCVEPNSELGKALRYLQKHWHKLSRFLSVAGAPLDNNVLERALKIAIRHRRASLFYRSRYSAHLGGMLTSLMVTCYLGQHNAHHYLTALQQHQAAVLQSPAQWLPWNYQVAVANQPAGSLVCLAAA
ncbi:MAG: IS66 family transposase [Gammaproteobacteria bacterium]|nr:IS66 family transposase [Gammaproteobacteria bacterium]